MPSGEWSADLEPAAADCDDASCAFCQVKAAGARAIAAAVGHNYDEFDQESQAHFRVIAGEAMAAMSAAMLEVGLVKPKETV